MRDPDLQAAGAAVDAARGVVDAAVRALAGRELDDHQVLAYDLAHAAAGVAIAGAALDYGKRGELEARIACAFVADTVHDLAGRVLGREEAWDVKPDTLEAVAPFVAAGREPSFLAELA